MMPSSIRKTSTTAITITGPVDLGELVEILDAEQQRIVGPATVSFDHYKGDQREPETTTITIRTR